MVDSALRGTRGPGEAGAPGAAWYAKGARRAWDRL